VICASPDYLKRRGTPKKPSDLKDHDCITVIGPGLNRWPFRSPTGIEIVEIEPRLATDDAEAAMRLAVAGAGIIRPSDVIISGALKRGELVPLLTDIHHVEPLPLVAVYPVGRHRLPRVAVFLKFIEERFGHAPWRGAA
jgi:DNA-binding transcriptional LysR family regulator